MTRIALSLVLSALSSLVLAMPFTPKGGLGTNSTPPVYRPLSDFDRQSLNLGLYQEYIELDVFHYGLAKFSAEDFDAAGIDAEDRFLIEFMADQEVAHANLISNILGPDTAPKPCNYSYPFETVREFIDFCQKVTRFGESGVYGFLEHMNSRAAANLLLQSIATEARQQLVFRQFEGLFPMPFDFIPGITQSMQWTLLAPYVTSCPSNNTRLAWQNFPGLNITNNPNITTLQNGDNTADISNNQSIPLSQPGRTLNLTWEEPGKKVGPDGSYNTSTSAGAPKFVAWISQLNTTYSSLTVLGNNSGSTIQPNERFINGTVFIMITDADPVITPANVSMLNPHVVAGLAMYQSG